MTKSPTSATAQNEACTAADAAAVPRLTSLQLEHLATHGWVVAPHFISKSMAAQLRDDIDQLRASSSSNHFSVAKIGEKGTIQDDTTPYRDVRHSETCEISPGVANLPPHPGRDAAYALLNQLRIDLQNKAPPGPATKDITLPLDSQLAELMYAYYPRGGYYRRHRDAEAATPSAWRQYSFLLYLNENWEPAHGGALRLHRDSGGDTLPADELPNFVDVPPHEGTLVVFRSDLVPHEVLTTFRERSAVVGWFLSAEEPKNINSNNTAAASANASTTNNACWDAATSTIGPETLRALRTLRDAVPRMAQKLKPQPPADHSGMIWAEPTNEWGIVMAGTPPSQPTLSNTTGPALEDDDVRYWKKVATFTVEGNVQTLSLAGQRLRQLKVPEAHETLVQSALLESVVTLDLANTDLSLDVLTAVLQAAPAVKQLYLGGNALGAQGLQAILPYLPQHAEILDLRYNDLDGITAAPHLQTLSSEKLHLEGNSIGDEGAAALNLQTCRELYLGQCGIGPTGAAALADKLEGSPLEKLYLEGNCIGDTGADALRAALEKGGQCVDKLYVDNNGLSKEYAIALGAAVNSATVIGEAGFYQN